MKARVTVLFFAFISLTHLQESTGAVTDERRILASLVRISSEGRRIQSGAYSTVQKKIFTLNTPDMREASDVFLDEFRLAMLAAFETRPNFMVLNGQNGYARIEKRIDDGDNMINLIMLQDFEPFIRGYENECGEPLPFGREARDDVAQLAGWIEFSPIIIQVKIKKNVHEPYIHVLLDDFNRQCESMDKRYNVKQGDLLIQSSKIIGFLKGIRNDENILIFYRAVSIITTDHNSFDLTESDGSENDHGESDDEGSACRDDFFS